MRCTALCVQYNYDVMFLVLFCWRTVRRNVYTSPSLKKILGNKGRARDQLRPPHKTAGAALVFLRYTFACIIKFFLREANPSYGGGVLGTLNGGDLSKMIILMIIMMMIHIDLG